MSSADETVESLDAVAQQLDERIRTASQLLETAKSDLAHARGLHLAASPQSET